MIQPFELQQHHPVKIKGGVATTTDVWRMLLASHEGDLEIVRELAERQPFLLHRIYDYTAPLHLAVREGHTELVRYMIERAGLDPRYRTHPYHDSLHTVASERGLSGIVAILEESSGADPARTGDWGETGKIDFGKDKTQTRFQQAVDEGHLAEVKAMLLDRPDLAHDREAFWGEGVLSMPAKEGDLPMVELLMSFGATVPDVSKWGKEYYFKNPTSCAFLLERGMNPNHRTWRDVTLLHDMAYLGDLDRAELLIKHGADLNALDDEFRSTPLGVAARWGQAEMVNLLIARDTDVNMSGATWATPLAWARSKGFSSIEGALVGAGAK